MEKKNGSGASGGARPGSGGAIRSIGESFHPNLSMGGGSYKVPIDLPLGSGGFAPNLDLVYNTGYENGPFGVGWMFSIPFITQQPRRPYALPEPPEYNLSGAERLVELEDGTFVPFVQESLQRFTFDGDSWTSVAPNLVEMAFGSDEESRIAGEVDGLVHVDRWLIDRTIFPGNREVRFRYRRDGNQCYVSEIRWSRFRLVFTYEARPDVVISHRAGFEIRTALRCRRITLHHDGLQESQIRTYDFAYDQAPGAELSLLREVTVTGWRVEEGNLVATPLAPLTFGYSEFSPTETEIRKFRSQTAPPPSLGDDVTLLDYRGTGLPGILRMNGTEATYWENRGDHGWGPPERLAALPQGLHLGNDRVRFADVNGNLAQDLVVGEAYGGGYYPNDPELGFLRKRRMIMAPSFGMDEPQSWFIDLDRDGAVDYLTLRRGVPMAFFNEDGVAWRGPVVLDTPSLPDLGASSRRMRLADMTGDGTLDFVLLRDRQIVYWPNLGNGRWGEPQIMADTPAFDVMDADRDVQLADIDGDGTADLVLFRSAEIVIHLNRSGQGFGEAIVLRRTPRLGVNNYLLADLTGSGTVGVLWNIDHDRSTPHAYWFLDFLGGTKPYLLQSIDNGMGQRTEIHYSTAGAERALDLAEGRRWSGYLPLAIHLVKRVEITDQVTGQRTATEFRYHDGHFDGGRREYLGFAEVDSREVPSTAEAPVVQRYFFHNRNPGDPFVVGKGQPRRVELYDEAMGQIRRVDESTWQAQEVAGSRLDDPAYLTFEHERRSERLEAGVAYAIEGMIYQRDEVGNITRETRTGRWDDPDGAEHVDILEIRCRYARHPVHGLTSLLSRREKIDGAGRLLKHASYYFDGAPFVGLPLGEAERGWISRQTEITLTDAEIVESYAAAVPPQIAASYREEVEADWGRVFVHDTRRYRYDVHGNAVETLDALGNRTIVTYDADAILPTTYHEHGMPARAVVFDPIAQQVAEMEDFNGHSMLTRYDGLGNVVAVWKRGADPARPTETYVYRRDVVPNVVEQRTRFTHDAAQPGHVKLRFLDGASRDAQVRTLTEDGRWSVGRQKIFSTKGKILAERDAYFSPTTDFEAVPPGGVALRGFTYDFAGRLLTEELFNGERTVYRYNGNAAEFFGPQAARQLAVNPATPAQRISHASAAGKVIANDEWDGAGYRRQQREHDGLGRLVRVIDAEGHEILVNYFDLRGNHIRIDSAEQGQMAYVLDAGSNILARTDADGRTLVYERDRRGRLLRLRRDQAGGAIEEIHVYDAGPGDNLIGRLARVEGDFGTVEYSYSAAGDPTRIRRTFAGDIRVFDVHFTYDAQRQVTSVRYPDNHVVDYTYHPTGLPAAIPDFVDDIVYDPMGLRTEVLYANGLHTTRRYTTGHDLLEELQTVDAAGTAFQHLVYQLDEIGQALRVDDLANVVGKIRNNQTFAYDEQYRLIGATGNRGAAGDYNFRYEYDLLGNLVFSGESFAEPMAYGHQEGDAQHPNRLVRRQAAANPEYEYDASGNLIRDPDVGRLSYDYRHRLTRVERPDGTIITYRYDHNNRRTEVAVAPAAAPPERRLEIEGLYLVEDAGATKVVLDQSRRLAILPDMGDPLLFHLDRLGNVNIVSNLITGDFVAQNEYTPYGALAVAILEMPAASFQGGMKTPDVDLVLLGARYYSPRLGRFLTADKYLLAHQNKLPAIAAGANLYLYGMANPVNFTDPTGQIAFLVVLGIAAIVGAVVGLIGAAANGAQTWDEWLLWIIGGAIGGALIALTGGGLAVLFGGSAATGALIATVIWGTVSLLGSILTPFLDDTNSEAAWVFSFILKALNSPITSIIGLVAWAVVAARGGNWDLRRGALFIDIGGTGNGAMTLGPVVWTQGGTFDAAGNVPDDLARHEAYHTRTVVALGELGFYFTYVTVGAIWGAAEGGAWNDLNGMGCGNPFEKSAHTFYSVSTTVTTATPTHNC